VLSYEYKQDEPSPLDSQAGDPADDKNKDAKNKPADDDGILSPRFRQTKDILVELSSKLPDDPILRKILLSLLSKLPKGKTLQQLGSEEKQEFRVNVIGILGLALIEDGEDAKVMLASSREEGQVAKPRAIHAAELGGPYHTHVYYHMAGSI